MKKIVYKYRISKFKRFANGLLFAIISCTALILCFSGKTADPIPKTDILLPFTIAAISLILGFFTMFHQEKNRHINSYKRKYN